MNILKRNSFYWIILSVIAFVIVFLSHMPKPIDMNLEKIGNGQKAVVFVYDPNLAISYQQATEINKARKILGEQAIFLIAKTGDPKGEGFKKRYHARSPDLLFFNREGELIDRQTALLSAEELTGKLSIK